MPPISNLFFITYERDLIFKCDEIMLIYKGVFKGFNFAKGTGYYLYGVYLRYHEGWDSYE